MRFPLKVQDPNSEKECPFYCVGSDNKPGCLVKNVIQKNTWGNVFKNISEQFNEEFESDCKGEFVNCCFANEIWSEQENTTTPIEENPVQEKEQEEEQHSMIKINVHKVENPYKVRSDVLIYPTNNLLQIDDRVLTRMSRNNIQKECDQIYEPKIMGNVYITSNGGTYPGGLAAKKVYHAVVAGESRLVNDKDIRDAMQKALMMADDEGAELVSVLPADCGTHDLEATAYAQLSAIRDFLNEIGVKNIKYIFIVMDDEESYDIFVDQFSIIFAD